MAEQPTTEQPYTRADVEWLGQAMRDDNPPEAWVHSNIVPLDHFARVALDALAAAGRLCVTGAKADLLLPGGHHWYWSTHCRHGSHEACSADWMAGTVASNEPRAAGVLGMSISVERQPAQCKHCASPCICPCHAPVSTDG